MLTVELRYGKKAETLLGNAIDPLVVVSFFAAMLPTIGYGVGALKTSVGNLPLGKNRITNMSGIFSTANLFASSFVGNRFCNHARTRHTHLVELHLGQMKMSRAVVAVELNGFLMLLALLKLLD